MLFAVLVEVLLRSGNDSSSSLLPSTAASKVASKKAERERECGKRGDREREKKRGREFRGCRSFSSSPIPALLIKRG